MRRHSRRADGIDRRDRHRSGRAFQGRTASGILLRRPRARSIPIHARHAGRRRPLAVGSPRRAARRHRPASDRRARPAADDDRAAAGSGVLPRRGNGCRRGAVEPPAGWCSASSRATPTASRSLASAIVSKPGFVVVLVSSARPALVVAARSQDGSVSANDVVKALTATFGGRGGGKPELAQAGGLDGEPGRHPRGGARRSHRS